MSESGRRLLTQWEGSQAEPYLDLGGKETIGVGHLLTDFELRSGTLVINDRSVAWRHGLNESQISELLQQDLRRYEAAVRSEVDVDLTQSQFDALVSFAFNIGVHGFAESTLLNRLNAGKYGDVPDQLRRWNKVQDEVSAGLVNRREREVELWNRRSITPVEPVAPVPDGPMIGATQLYTVAPGDTLTSVARRFGVTVFALARANNLINPADFTVGRVMTIPLRKEQSASYTGELSARDVAKNTSQHLTDRAKVARQTVSPTLVAGVDHREQVGHIVAVQQFGRDLGLGIKADGVAGPLTYGLTLTLQRGMIDGPYLESPLKPDAAPGPATTAMLGFSRDNNFRCSKNFRWTEFDTKNPDRVVSKHNPVLKIDRALIILAQKIRDHVGIAFSPISAYRDAEWNEVVGGSLASQHMLGKAIDIASDDLRLSESTVRRLGATGVGIVRASGFVSHVDTRSVPAKWFY